MCASRVVVPRSPCASRAVLGLQTGGGGMDLHLTVRGNNFIEARKTEHGNETPSLTLVSTLSGAQLFSACSLWLEVIEHLFLASELIIVQQHDKAWFLASQLIVVDLHRCHA